MSKPNIRVFSSLEELSWAALTRFEELIGLEAKEKKRFSVALSGGETPKVLYEILGSEAVSIRIPWHDIHLFQVDERCVRPDHPQSNYRMIREALLSRAPIPDPNFHRMPAEWPDRQRASSHYAEEIRRVLRPKEGELPRLDLVLLGMGADGHTASLFPGTPAVDEQVLWVRENYVEKLKMHRLTLTLPVLNAAAEIIFLVSGDEKAESLREVLEGPMHPEKYPAQRVQPVQGQVSWFVDEAAARLLSRVPRSVS